MSNPDDFLIELEPSHTTSERSFYSVTFRNEYLLTDADPETAACRRLLEMGFTGKLRVRWKGSEHDALIIDIERGAKLRVVESRAYAPRWTEFQPFDAQERFGNAISRSRVPPKSGLGEGGRYGTSGKQNRSLASAGATEDEHEPA